jgi:hypothetical protein
MAIPGFGYRLVNDLLMEISKHVVEPILLTTLTAPVVTPGSQTVLVGSVLDPNNSELAVYIGAQVVVDTGANAEIVTITAFTVSPASITAVFAGAHASGVPLTGATFPTQHATDEIYGQAEMIGYVARAQNEFLEQVPVAFSLFYQSTITGQMLQSLPANAIELNHVSLSQLSLPITSLVRAGGIVTATFANPHGLLANGTFWIVQPADLTFQGVFRVASVPDPYTLTYLQFAEDAATADGTAAYFVRLYELTQEELSMNNRQWRSTWGTPSAFYEDRTGNYQWGLGAIPAVGAPLELICSIRDSDTLTLLDGFLIADTILHFVKWLAISYIASKDGCYRNEQLAQYGQMRFKRGVMAVQRLIDNQQVGAQGAG